MDLFSNAGRWLVLVGVSIALAGAVLWLLGKMGGWKELPGTIRIDGNGFSCVFPLLASILLSIILTLVINLVLRFFRH